MKLLPAWELNRYSRARAVMLEASTPTKVDWNCRPAYTSDTQLYHSMGSMAALTQIWDNCCTSTSEVSMWGL